MIKVENIEVTGSDHAIRGMRNPMNSWDKSDSRWTDWDGRKDGFNDGFDSMYEVGNNDLKLMKSLFKGGTEHRKYARMINVYMDITAPQYWWSEYDTYKIGTVANSCSKMHRLLYKPFEMSDFSFDKLPGYKNEIPQFPPEIDADKIDAFEKIARPLIDTLNELRDSYLLCEDPVAKKEIWYSILQLLPESYNQKRTIMMNYETVFNIIRQRKNHKLDEWNEFVGILQDLPYIKEIME